MLSSERKALIAKFSGSDQPVGKSEPVVVGVSIVN